MEIDKLLQEMIDKKASDLHLRVGSPPVIRIDGRLSPCLDWSPMSVDDAESVFEFLTTPSQRETFNRDWNKFTFLRLHILSNIHSII